MKNILITGISYLPRWRKDANYICNDIEIKISATQTNEACCKYLISKYPHIDKVISLTTPETLQKNLTLEKPELKPDAEKISSYEFFQKRVHIFCKEHNFHEPEFQNIEMYEEESNENNFERVLKKVADNIRNIGSPDEIQIFLDIAGGLRNISILIQQLTKFLGYYGYKTEAYYTSYDKDNEKKNRFYNCHNSYEQMEILDAVNEFITKGSSIQLSRIFSNVNSEPVNAVLCSLKDFSDAIQLCQTDKLQDILKDMNDALKELEALEENKDNIFVLQLMIPLIRQKFSLDDTKYDYTGMIEWCLNNGYIQQALTLYTEKIPEYIFNSGIITVPEEKIAETAESDKGNPTKSNAYATLFYDKLLENATDKNAPDFRPELEKYFYSGDKLISADKNEISKISHKKLRIFLEILSDIQDKKYPHICRQNPEKYTDTEYNTVRNEIEKYKPNNSFKSLINTIKTNYKQVNGFIYDIPISKKTNDKSGNPISKKLEKVHLFTIQDMPEYFTSYISEEDIKKIFYNYIYVKGIRNRINHASKKENFTLKDSDFYENSGLKTHDFSPEDLTKYIYEFLNHLKTLVK